MTNQQKITIEEYKRQYKENCETYEMWGSSQYCKMGIYKNPNNDDPNITMVITSITGLSDDYQPYFKTDFILIEPDGNALPLKETFPDEDVVGYIQTLEKID